MALKISDAYVNAVAPDTNYPGGSFKNKSAPSATDGTPLEKQWANDLYGFGEAILLAGGVDHSGAPDTAIASDRLDALMLIIAGLNNPIGTIRAFSVATDPATLLGIGTWTRIGAGRMVVDAGTGFAAGATGGEVTHILTTAEMPSHSHPFPQSVSAQQGTDNGGASTTDAGSARNPTMTLGSTGGGGAHNNMPPYYVGYIWKRVS